MRNMIESVIKLKGWSEILKKDIKRFLNRDQLEKIGGILDSDGVVILKKTDKGILANVKDSGGDEFEVELWLVSQEIYSSCTCFEKFDDNKKCRHFGAVLRTLVIENLNFLRRNSDDNKGVENKQVIVSENESSEDKKVTRKEISIDMIREFSDTQSIYSRGVRLYENGLVFEVFHKEGIWYAKVKGSGRNVYDVKVFLNNLNEIDGSCTCPYLSKCKHCVAVMFCLMYDKKEVFNVLDSNKNHKLLEFGNVLSEKKVEEKKGFDFMSFDKVMSYSSENILSALKYVDRFVNLKFDKDRIQGYLIRKGRGGIVEVRFVNNYVFSGDCFLDAYKYDVCDHQLALLIRYFKEERVHDLPKDFMKEIEKREVQERFDGLSKFLSTVDVENKDDVKSKRVKFVFEFDGEKFEIKKRQILRNNSLGGSSNTTIGLVKKNLSSLSKVAQKTFNLFFGTSREGYSYYQRDELSKGDFSSFIDLEVLKLFRALYSEDNESFFNVEFLYGKADFELVVTNNKEKGFVFGIFVDFNGEKVEVKRDVFSFFGFENSWMKFYDEKKGRYILFEVGNKYRKVLDGMIEYSGVVIGQSIFDDFLENYYLKLSKIMKVVLPVEKKVESCKFELSPRIFLKNYATYFSFELGFLYGKDNEVRYNDGESIVFRDVNSGSLKKVERDYDIEKNYFLKVLEHDVLDRDGMLFPAIDPIEWLADKASNLIESGFEFFGESSLVNMSIIRDDIDFKIDVTSGIDWFDLNIDMSFGKEKVSFDKVKNALSKNERFVKLSNGKIGVIPKKWMKKLSGVIGFLESSENGDGDDDGNNFKASKAQIQIVEELLGVADKFVVDKKFKEIREKFKSFNGIDEGISVPKGLNGELREYQRAGFLWLNFLRDFGFGGVLADEMGLGKTLQVLSLLLKEKEEGRIGTCLIVVPTSLVFNWQREIEKFTPDLNFYVHYGPDRIKDLNKRFYDVGDNVKGVMRGKGKKNKGVDLIITTYGTLRNDIEEFKKYEFYYVVLDESQSIKNPLSKIAKCVYSLKCKNKLVMTGTPVENNSLDLWSQFAFLNPGFLGGMNFFKSSFMKKINEEKDMEKMFALRNMTNPFLLMRKKNIVAKDLPDKQIMVQYCEMNDKHRVFYDKWKSKIREDIAQAVNENGVGGAKLKILQGLIRLRQIANHPRLVDESYEGSSGKIDVLFDKINEVIAEGHKILVFSSFVGMLKIIREKFDEEGIGYSYLDGSSRKRENIVDEFVNDENKQVFLISIKAGGVGLNLTVADYVFIVDPWWNPAVEMQAIDRTHRIGQKCKVFVYKTITKDSVEEKILELQESKIDLVKNVIASEEGVFKSLSQKDVDNIFK